MTNGTNPIIVAMQDLPQAAAAQLTDEIIACQNANGCDADTPLVRMTLQQLSDLIVARVTEQLAKEDRR